jgi:hypothetical protein
VRGDPNEGGNTPEKTGIDWLIGAMKENFLSHVHRPMINNGENSVSTFLLSGASKKELHPSIYPHVHVRSPLLETSSHGE